MTVISPEFQAHLDREVTTLCHCWRLARRDGVVLGFTDHDAPISIEGTTFEPQTGLIASEARATLGLAPDAQDVEGALTSARIADADIEAGRYDGATIETLLVNWRAPEQHRLLRQATAGTIVRQDGRFVVEMQSLAAKLERVVGRTIRRGCDAELGDTRCGVDLETPGFSAEGTVLAEGGPQGLLAGGLDAFEGGWFSLGTLTATSGAAAGLTRRVAEHRVDADGARILLSDRSGPALAEGDTFVIRAGCDKRFATCRTKFANVLNFRGFPHLPGNDAAYAYVSEGQLFDGGPLVPS